MGTNESLVYKIDVIEGLSIDELSKSLLSINDEFNRFTSGSKSLLIKEIRKGSGIFEFIGAAAVSSVLVLQNINTCIQFVKYLSSVKDVVIGKEAKLPDDLALTSKTIDNANAIFQPVVIGNNNTVSVFCGNKITLSIDQEEYNEFLCGKKRIKQLKPEMPNAPNNISQLYKKVLFRWLQTRFDDSRSGNRGVIKSIQDKAVKIIFENDNSDTKREMTTSHSNVDWQKVGYIVDVETIIENGNIVAYKIMGNYPDDCIMNPDEIYNSLFDS
jgi:hypothetical protein